MQNAACCEKHIRICKEIETVRGEMVALGTEFGFLHPDVQLCSRRLDQLLLRFYALDHTFNRTLQTSALERLTR